MTRKVLVDNDAAQYDDILGRLRRLEQSGPEPPHYVGAAGEPAFQGSWVSYDANRAVFFYRHNGRVYLGGILRTGVSATVAFTLPDGYRPLVQSFSYFPVSASGGVAQLTISDAGVVTPANFTGSAVATHCSLEGVSFRHA